MKPEPRVFTKQNPCNKADIWECFRMRGGWRIVQVDEAHALIGINVPRVMERNGYLIRVRQTAQDKYALTPTGEAWLLKGALAFAKNHPSEAHRIAHLPTTDANVRARRTRSG